MELFELGFNVTQVMYLSFWKKSLTVKLSQYFNHIWQAMYENVTFITVKIQNQYCQTNFSGCKLTLMPFSLNNLVYDDEVDVLALCSVFVRILL